SECSGTLTAVNLPQGYIEVASSDGSHHYSVGPDTQVVLISSPGNPMAGVPLGQQITRRPGTLADLQAGGSGPWNQITVTVHVVNGRVTLIEVFIRGY